jgi:hypothetical protein
VRVAAEAVWEGRAHVQATDVRVVEAGGAPVGDDAPVCGGRTWWWRCSVMAGADGRGSMRACVGPMSSSLAGYGDPWSDLVR